MATLTFGKNILEMSSTCSPVRSDDVHIINRNSLPPKADEWENENRMARPRIFSGNTRPVLQPLMRKGRRHDQDGETRAPRTVEHEPARGGK